MPDLLDVESLEIQKQLQSLPSSAKESIPLEESVVARIQNLPPKPIFSLIAPWFSFEVAAPEVGNYTPEEATTACFELLHSGSLRSSKCNNEHIGCLQVS